jgi:high affinity Mn2+ porin
MIWSTRRFGRVLGTATLCLVSASLRAEPLVDIHAQLTSTVQAHPAFRGATNGPNSLDHNRDAAVTNDLTLYLGVSPWKGAEIWYNPELDQGFGLSDTLGVAGFTSGEAYKVGKQAPYFRSQRIFLRQTIGLGGDEEQVESDANQHKAKRRTDRLVLTLGKFSVGDIFDINKVAHDPRQDFFNWSIIDTGTFDYAADSWGYSAGGAAELYAGPWTARVALVALSNAPNGETLNLSFAQRQWIGEAEYRFKVRSRDGAIRVTAFDSYARIGRFADALSLAALTNSAPDTALVRHYGHRAGVSVNAEQAMSGAASVFVRAGLADGSHETYDFTDIDRTLAAGFSLKGKGWQRPADMLGGAFVVNDISKARQAYLTAGGLGVLIGDGALAHKKPETIFEGYYNAALAPWAHLTIDGQLVINPAYNADRGPAIVFGVRLHFAR